MLTECDFTRGDDRRKEGDPLEFEITNNSNLFTCVKKIDISGVLTTILTIFSRVPPDALSPWLNSSVISMS
jgi:hypothetical protein